MVICGNDLEILKHLLILLLLMAWAKCGHIQIIGTINNYSMATEFLMSEDQTLFEDSSSERLRPPHHFIQTFVFATLSQACFQKNDSSAFGLDKSLQYIEQSALQHSNRKNKTKQEQQQQQQQQRQQQPQQQQQQQQRQQKSMRPNMARPESISWILHLCKSASVFFRCFTSIRLAA